MLKLSIIFFSISVIIALSGIVDLFYLPVNDSSASSLYDSLRVECIVSKYNIRGLQARVRISEAATKQIGVESDLLEIQENITSMREIFYPKDSIFNQSPLVGLK